MVTDEIKKNTGTHRRKIRYLDSVDVIHGRKRKREREKKFLHKKLRFPSDWLWFDYDGRRDWDHMSVLDELFFNLF